MQTVLTSEKLASLWFDCSIERKDASLLMVETPVFCIKCEYYNFWTTSWGKLPSLTLLCSQHC